MVKNNVNTPRQIIRPSKDANTEDKTTAVPSLDTVSSTALNENIITLSPPRTLTIATMPFLSIFFNISAKDATSTASKPRTSAIPPAATKTFPSLGFANTPSAIDISIISGIINVKIAINAPIIVPNFMPFVASAILFNDFAIVNITPINPNITISIAMAFGIISSHALVFTNDNNANAADIAIINMAIEVINLAISSNGPLFIDLKPFASFINL